MYINNHIYMYVHTCIIYENVNNIYYIKLLKINI